MNQRRLAIGAKKVGLKNDTPNKVVEMQKIKKWIQNSNGWQRLWLVGSITGFIYLGWVVPIQASSSYSQFKFTEMRRVEAEIKKAECAPYINEAFNLLPTDPASRSNCSNIYLERKNSKNNQPFAIDVYEAEMNSRIRFSLHDDIKFGLIYATFLSGIVYVLGALAAWVIKGFRKKEL